MLQVVIILVTSLIILPLIDLTATEAARPFKIAVLLVALILVLWTVITRRGVTP